MGLVVVLGGHGQIALRLLPLLAEQGHRARGVIRNPEHAGELERLGAEAAVCDVEVASAGELTDHVRGADAVVFAAGAGPGSGPERKRTVDYGGAVKLIDACQQAGVGRYVMISAIGADDPSQGAGPMGPYLQAKHDADEALIASGLKYTVVRPGRLTDDPGTGLIQVGERLPRGDIPREDVAATVAACLRLDATVERVFVALGGDTPIDEALSAL